MPATLRFRWQESGGPVIVVPDKRGFGTRMVEQSVRRELEGAAEIAFDPAGLQCRIEIPLTRREDRSLGKMPRRPLWPPRFT